LAAKRDTYHAGLSRASVVSAAVERLQLGGLGGFSVRRLAADLGVDSMALYKHVRHKDDLLGAAMRQVFQDVSPRDGGEWWEQVQATYEEHRRVIREHPWVLSVMLGHSLESTEPWGGVEELLALLTKHLGPEGAARWARLLAAFTNGFLLTEPDLVDAPEEGRVGSDLPLVAQALGRNARSGDVDFAHGLQSLIAAMRAEHDERPPLRRVT
jgi:AcrR family transcriptional regulator